MSQTSGVGPCVGVGVLVVNPDNRLLIGKRKSSLGAGKFETSPSRFVMAHIVGLLVR